MDFQKFTDHLDRGQLTPCYLFSGEEEYLIEESTRKLIERVVEPANRDFNLDIFYAAETGAGKIIDTASAYPMLAESRVVVVKEIEKLSTKNIEALSKYVAKPSATTKLVLTSLKAKLTGKSFAHLKKQTTFVEFKPLYDNQVPGWISNYVSGRGFKINRQACLLIHARVGNNLRAIVNEVDKILLNLGERNNINADDVQSVVGLSRTFNVFNLNDALGNRDLRTSLKILRQMLEAGESPTGILAMISRHFSNLLKVKGAERAKKSQQEMVAATGLPPFILKKVIEMSRNYSFRQIEMIFESLLETDFSLKSSSLKPEIALQTLLVQITDLK